MAMCANKKIYSQFDFNVKGLQDFNFKALIIIIIIIITIIMGAFQDTQGHLTKIKHMIEHNEHDITITQ